jgi:multicomponent Na+:H+ antiporter subunit F
MTLTIATFAILAVMGLALTRAFLGPTLQDRILAVNLFGTKTVLFIAITAFFFGSTHLLDIAMVYALINFISVIGALQYYEQNPPAGLRQQQ